MIGRNKMFSIFASFALISSVVLKAEETTKLDDVTIEERTSNATENSDSYTINYMSSATKMKLSALETPQSVSVVTSQQMEDFMLTDINDVLDVATGIDVQKVERDRTHYTSRGFDITNFLIDGVGAPTTFIYINGDLNMSLYDHVEVTRGATGLSSNHGDPSASINLVRKRPTKEFQASTELSAGSWNTKGLEVDVSGPLNEDKTVRYRVIGSFEDSESFQDRYKSKTKLLSAMFDADITDNSTLTVGISKNIDDNDGTEQGGFDAYSLAVRDYDISTTTAPDWAYRDIDTTDAFLELDTNLSDFWKIKGTYAYKKIDQDAQMLTVWHTGANPSQTYLENFIKSENETKQHIFDITVDGIYNLFDKDHEVVFGLNYTRQEYDELNSYDTSNYGTIIDLDTWDGSTATPEFDDRYSRSDWTQKERSFFAATNFHITDSLSLLAGSKLVTYEKSGINSNSALYQKDSNKFLPYASLSYKFNDNLATYVSYTTTFTPQSEIDASATQLTPKEGINYEAGIKSSFFGGKLNTAFALFKTKQDNVAESVGILSDGTGRTYYRAIDGVTTKGFEFEVAGNITDEIDASLGYTNLTIKDADNLQVNAYIPRQMLKATLSYSPNILKALKVGASANYRSETNNAAIKQGKYTIYNLVASYKINKAMKLAFNVDNVFDKKYYGGLIKPYATYGAPRSFGVSFEYKF
ncbi:hypothetical protein CRV08_03650 [Halarcobacter ebronensis]|uniref:TonB-dependent siderophore receptor n=1 Tax=Halarcobacter ebronensis TaxID=1462615 RepID=A0A4Q0YF11_9BACT|nr:TonB-dependent siderophore receptor [Halarcobacter ebronensis]RXJ69117.1 hypothetical protein CRV08_03650 [Halarcobacter ebronensis]